ncbi:hypothetical protein ACFST9_23040 [Hymenobacter monticola]|uniref:Uncharacterized protein n=1 Tax=Hymenobacter monticola TaxID=1705399 RepID=A0ABY4B4E8_9BACT|nr:hypothetical protein [Hymenobacter monticola]UOE34024.1 hypothetical protein MTP16_23280 [Hymenobacter monticola]
MNSFATRFLLLLTAASSLVACRETSKLPAPATEDVPLIIPEVNPQKSYFNILDARPSVDQARNQNRTRPVFEFVVNPSKGGGDIQTVEVYKSYRRDLKLGPRVKVTDLTSFPATVTINSQDALQDLYATSPIAGSTTPRQPVKGETDTTPNRLINGEAVVFTFEYVMKDGRRIILTPLSTLSGSVGAPLGTFVNAPYAAVAEIRP